jgi:hypothetical protein
MASSKSLVNALARYARTRITTWRVAGLTALIAVAGVAASTYRSVDDSAHAMLISLLLVIQFRLWDDLADLRFDLEHHPGRVLVNETPWLARFQSVVVWLALALIGSLGYFRTELHVLAYSSLLGGFAAFYRWGTVPRLLRVHVVNLKYPAFIYLASAHPGLQSFATIAAGVYLLLMVIELATDPLLMPAMRRRRLLGFESAAFLIILGVALWLTTR